MYGKAVYYDRCSWLFLALIYLAGCASSMVPAPSLSDALCASCNASTDTKVLMAILAHITKGLGQRYVVVNSEPHAWLIERTWVERETANLPTMRRPPDLGQLIGDYTARNVSAALPRDLSSSSLRVTDSHYLQQIFAGDVIGGWKRFRLAFPDADALVQLSLPGYSTSQDWAILSYSVERGSMAGDFMAAVLQNRRGSWTVEWSGIIAES